MSSMAIPPSEIFRGVPNLYPKDLVGKTFEEYLSKKYNYGHRNNFTDREIKKANAEYENLAKVNFQKQLENLNKIYNNIFFQSDCGSCDPGFFVIGSGNLRQRPEERRNLGTLSENSKDTGAIFAPKKWSLLVNDTMLVAAINAVKQCMLYQPPLTDSWEERDFQVSDVWENDAPRVFARELAILKAAGYVPIQEHPALGIVLICRDPEKASKFTIADAHSAAENLYHPNELLNFLNEPYTPANFYSSWCSQSELS